MRRTIPILVSSTLALGLLAVIPAAPAAAQPTCEGRTATITDNGPGDNDPSPGFIEGTNGPDIIVGTNGDDFIKGKGGRDLICGRRGLDSIDGGGKRDRIFGGGDNDILFGGPGGDDLFGFKGNDQIFGQAGNDFINGGKGTDECFQGKGRGPIRQCEKADLKVTIIPPSSPASADGATFRVRVKNRGSDASAYVLTVGEDNSGATCNAPWEDDPRFYGKLRKGQQRTRSFTTVCTLNSDTPQVRVSAEVTAIARDPKPGNDEAKSPFVDLEE